MNRLRSLFYQLWLFLMLSFAAAPQDTNFAPQGSQIPGPGNPTIGALWQAGRDDWRNRQVSERGPWLADLKHWRREYLIRIGYDATEYDRPELKWTQRNFIQPQMMVEERYFYDPESRKYTVDRYLDDLDKRYGGIDSVLIWPVYPNIGIDNRNQWDLHRDLPGGIPGLRKMVEDFHRRNVKVFFPAMPWDMGTRDEGVPHSEATARLMAEIGADGVNGDTFYGLPRTYRAASDKTGHPVALEPEGAPQGDEALMWNTQSWAYWKYTFAPLISKLKWLEPRHMINVCNRWARDKTDDLQYAFFNGVGYETWENVWGVWNGITPRDAEALRRVSKIERSFADLLVSPDWEPYVPTLQFGIFATQFPRNGANLCALINRNEYGVSGAQIEVPHRAGRKYFDVWHGLELTPRVENDRATLSFDIEGRGFGAILALESGAQWPNLSNVLDQMRGLSRERLDSFSHEWKHLPQRMVEIRPANAPKPETAGMIRIPGSDFDFNVTGVELEGYNWVGLDVQYPWEDAARRAHRKLISVKPFYIDRYPVTNEEFKRFLDSAHYRPADDHNFLKDWSNGSYPNGWAKKPVTWISIEDARAYAAWSGKRLPHEWEWQYAAQGSDGRLYPWGNSWDPAMVPEHYEGRGLPGPADVDSHPRGASPFGVADLVGNVWQWTDEYVDEHTRAAVLKGGSYYHPQGSRWYFPQAYRLDQHGKYLLMAPSKDRSGTVGFRCVMDAVAQ